MLTFIDRKDTATDTTGRINRPIEPPSAQNFPVSREGLRVYARGRAYIPGRYGGVTPYTDPNQLFRAMQAAEAEKKGKRTFAGLLPNPKNPDFARSITSTETSSRSKPNWNRAAEMASSYR